MSGRSSQSRSPYTALNVVKPELTAAPRAIQLLRGAHNRARVQAAAEKRAQVGVGRHPFGDGREEEITEVVDILFVPACSG